MNRGLIRSSSALVMLAYVICHFADHICLLVSIPLADTAHHYLIDPWRTSVGTALVCTALAAHYANALWSIYVRRHLRLSRWGWWQLGFGLSIPLFLALHIAATRLSEYELGVLPDYTSVLLRQWVITPWKGVAQVFLVSAVWTHAAIGIHFWWRTKRWYAAWHPALIVFAIVWPVLALAGYVAGGSTLARAAEQAGYLSAQMARIHLNNAARIWGDQVALWIIAGHIVMVGAALAARALRRWWVRRASPATLRHADGHVIAIMPGATVLETLFESHIPHASVCGGRARCTTCRVRVLEGLDALPPPSLLEARALERIGAPADCRLACQIRPISNLSILPLLSATATPDDGHSRTGFAGQEQFVTVMFVDLRGSTKLGEARLPYDVLFLLDQVFREMTVALTETGGHFSQFTGDGLMAIYGMDEGSDAASGARAALAGARDMLARLDRLNTHLLADLPQPLKIGIGIHQGVAIVGPLGPPGSQIITAIGDTVNTTARLEGLSKQYGDAPLIVSRICAEAAGIDLSKQTLRSATLSGRAAPVEYYALTASPGALAPGV
ncbi:MAG TPA: adenylate/guanylate cyclase domain-containing protein [Magnetospirillaceae bacterium]|jgi:adenylate cyclase